MNLTALQHSAFLQSLGWAIANSLWQSAVVWAAYHIVNASYKNATSKFRNLLSTTLLFSIFVWFTQTFLHRLSLLQDQFKLKATEGVNAFNYTPPVNSNWKILLNNTLNNLPYLSVAYLLLLLIFSIRLINSYRNINFIKNNGLQKPPVEWRLFMDKVVLHIGINKKIKLWFSEHVDVPATLGFIKPVILIPLATVNQLSPDQLEAIILHELSHIKRNDYFINLFISIIETILFFNPFVVLLSKIIKRERENCCDDFVIQYKYDPHSYASALLSLEQSRVTNLRLALTATSGKKQLLLRIKRIMESKRSNTNFNYGQKLLALILVTGIITSVAWLSPQKKGTVSETAKQTNPVLSKPIWELKLKERSSTIQQSAKISAVKNKKNLQYPKVVTSFNREIKVTPGKEEKEPFFTYDDNKTVPDQNKEFVSTFQAPESFPVPATPPAVFYRNTAPTGAFKDTAFLKELSRKIDLKKLQAAFEKTNLSFSVDWAKWHDEITNSFQKIPFGDFMLPGYQKLSGEEIEKLVQNEMKNLRTRTSRVRVPITTGRLNTNNQKLTKKLFVLIDSLASLTTAVLDKSDQKYFRKLPEPCMYKVQAPVKDQNYADAARSYQYQNFTDDENLADKKAPNLHLQKNQLYRYNYELREGVIILNGKKQTPPAGTKSASLFKSKKSVTINSDGDNIIRIQVED